VNDPSASADIIEHLSIRGLLVKVTTQVLINAVTGQEIRGKTCPPLSLEETATTSDKLPS
jgi:hypothetical protein